jgi:hypothetical protein
MDGNDDSVFHFLSRCESDDGDFVSTSQRKIPSKNREPPSKAFFDWGGREEGGVELL